MFRSINKKLEVLDRPVSRSSRGGGPSPLFFPPPPKEGGGTLSETKMKERRKKGRKLAKNQIFVTNIIMC